MTHEDHDETLRDAIDALPREIEPERDLWPGIAARIAPAGRRWQRWPAAAAVAALVAIGAIGAAVVLPHRQAPATFAVRPVTRTQPLATTTMPNERARAMAATIRSSTRGDAKTQAVLLKNLGITETSITAIQQALREDPGNPGLQPLLYQQYRDEAALVTAAQRVHLQTATGVIAP